MAEKKLFLFNEGVLKIETYPLWMLKLLLVTVLYFSVAATILAHPAQGTDTTPPSWMRHAIIYGIKPSGFTDHSSYDNISAKIAELKELGINTIWLQPVFKTARGGQGYDITDYFSLRDDLGNEQQLKNLISTAHQLHIKVLFDFVPNHTSIRQPFAQDIIKKRKSSPYYDYYQHENDGAPYSSNYHKDSSGFIFYFWKDLINLNYNNPEVRKMITDACKYWIQEFDIDGYRFDAVWAVNARAPEFGKHLRKELKALKIRAATQTCMQKDLMLLTIGQATPTGFHIGRGSTGITLERILPYSTIPRLTKDITLSAKRCSRVSQIPKEF